MVSIVRANRRLVRHFVASGMLVGTSHPHTVFAYCQQEYRWLGRECDDPGVLSERLDRFGQKGFQSIADPENRVRIL